MVRKGPRARMQIYFDIMKVIQEELTKGEEIKPTRIQFQSNLSYDNLLSYLSELEKLKMISTNPISVTEKGRSFVQDYDKITNYLSDVGMSVSSIKDVQI